MKYRATVKSKNGCYWWMDSSIVNRSDSYFISYDADSDDEALYIAALMSFANYEESLFSTKVLSAIRIVGYENNFNDCPFGLIKLEDLMDNPKQYINQNRIRISRFSPYIMEVAKIDGDSESTMIAHTIWKNEIKDPNYKFPEKKAYVAWYGEPSDLKSGKLNPKYSRKYYAPDFENAPLAAALKIVCNFYPGDKLYTEREPCSFENMLYTYSQNTLECIYFNKYERLCEKSPNRLCVGVIQDSDNNIIWKNGTYVDESKLKFPDRSVLFH